MNKQRLQQPLWQPSSSPTTITMTSTTEKFQGWRYKLQSILRRRKDFKSPSTKLLSSEVEKSSTSPTSLSTTTTTRFTTISTILSFQNVQKDVTKATSEKYNGMDLGKLRKSKDQFFNTTKLLLSQQICISSP